MLHRLSLMWPMVVSQEGPRRSMRGHNASQGSDDILVDLHPEGMGYLLGYLQAPEPRILPFHRYDGLRPFAPNSSRYLHLTSVS